MKYIIIKKIIKATSTATPQPEPEEKKEKKSRVRSNTVNARPDVENMRKEILKKTVSKDPESPTSPSVSSPSSPSSPSSSTSQYSPSSSTTPSGPIPKDTKKRRQRALSLSTTERPPTPTRPTVVPQETSSGEVELSSPDSSSSSSSSSGPSSPIKAAAGAPPGSLRLSGQSRASVAARNSSNSRRISLKDIFRKTFGLKEGDSEVKPRSLPFYFSVSTTSAKDAKELVIELEKNLFVKQIAFERENFLFLCRKDDLAFELEICKLPRLSVNGFRFKRLAGDQWAYKALCTDILSGVNL